MKNKFPFTESLLAHRSKIEEILENYELRNIPCATVDSKDGVVLEINCFPAAAEIYKDGFVQQTFEAALKMAKLSNGALKTLLLTEDFTRHAAYLRNVERWFNDLSNFDEVEIKTFEEFTGLEESDIIISNSDLRFESIAQRVIQSRIPCFPSPYAGWWRRSKIGTCRQIDESCQSADFGETNSNLKAGVIASQSIVSPSSPSSLQTSTFKSRYKSEELGNINPLWVQPDYSYVSYDKFTPDVLEKLKLKTLEMISLYPEGVFVKSAAGTQGYGCSYISSPSEYDKKDVRETLSLHRGFRGSKIHGLLIQKCMTALSFPLQLLDSELRLVSEEERPAELYFIMVADDNLRPRIYDTLIRIGLKGRCYNINKPGEFFKNFTNQDFANFQISPDDLEAAALTARLAYVAVDSQVEKFVQNPFSNEAEIYNLQ